MQVLFTSLAISRPGFRRLVEEKADFLFYEGVFYERRMHKQRVNKDDFMEALRIQGIGRLEDVEAVVLESSGTISIIEKKGSAPMESLREVGSQIREKTDNNRDFASR